VITGFAVGARAADVDGSLSCLLFVKMESRYFNLSDRGGLGMGFDDRMDFAAGQLAAATLAQIESDRERLRKLWIGLNEAESVIRRGQLAYLESMELLMRGNGSAVSDRQ
jgi:hypothetical protein